MLRDWYFRYEHRIGFFAIAAGFTFDYLTLWRIDLWSEHILIITYLLTSTLAIIYLSLVEERQKTGAHWQRFYTAGLFILQFALAGLFGRFLLFYSISGTISGSWPFLIILFGLLIANELSRERYQRYVLRMTAFSIVLLSYSILVLPVVLAHLSDWIFILSVITSFVLFSLLNRFILTFFKSFREKRLHIISLVACIHIIVTVLYFANFIPPVPLSLKDSGVYHSLIHDERGYVVTTEEYNFLGRLTLYKDLHLKSGERLYAFSSVFAPTRITTSIVHKWQKEESDGHWQTLATIPFEVVGGRDGGYKGYSQKFITEAGRYRVNIETPRGGLIGRIKFDVILDSGDALLLTKIK